MAQKRYIIKTDKFVILNVTFIFDSNTLLIVLNLFFEKVPLILLTEYSNHTVTFFAEFKS